AERKAEGPYVFPQSTGTRWPSSERRLSVRAVDAGGVADLPPVRASAATPRGVDHQMHCAGEDAIPGVTGAFADLVDRFGGDGVVLQVARGAPSGDAVEAEHRESLRHGQATGLVPVGEG